MDGLGPNIMRYFLAGPFQETLKKLLHESRMWAQKAPSLAVKIEEPWTWALIAEELAVGYSSAIFLSDKREIRSGPDLLWGGLLGLNCLRRFTGSRCHFRAAVVVSAIGGMQNWDKIPKRNTIGRCWSTVVDSYRWGIDVLFPLIGWWIEGFVCPFNNR